MPWVDQNQGTVRISDRRAIESAYRNGASLARLFAGYSAGGKLPIPPKQPERSKQVSMRFKELGWKFRNKKTHRFPSGAALLSDLSSTAIYRADQRERWPVRSLSLYPWRAGGQQFLVTGHGSRRRPHRSNLQRTDPAGLNFKGDDRGSDIRPRPT